MDQKLSWEELMLKAQSGDHKMYHLLLQQISKYIEACLRRKVKEPSLIQDLLQETLISVHKARHTYDANLPFKPWLIKIMNSRLIDHFRKVKNKSELETYTNEEDFNYLVADADVSQLEIQNLKSSINQLSEDQQKVLIAIKFEGKSVSLVSKELKISESSVKVIAHRAYKSLFEIMDVSL